MEVRADKARAHSAGTSGESSFLFFSPFGAMAAASWYLCDSAQLLWPSHKQEQWLGGGQGPGQLTSRPGYGV